MDLFPVLIVFSLLLIFVGAVGGKQLAEGKRAVGIFSISIALLANLLVVYCIYVYGLLYAQGHQLTLQKIFTGVH